MQAFSTLPHPPPITRQHWPWHLLRCTKFLLWVYALFSSVLSRLFNFLLLKKKKSLLQPTKLIAQASNRSRWAFCKTLPWNPISGTLYSLKRNDTRCCLWPAWSGMTRCWAHLFSTCSYLTLRLNLFNQDVTDLWILLVEVWEKETNFFFSYPSHSIHTLIHTLDRVIITSFFYASSKNIKDNKRLAG